MPFYFQPIPVLLQLGNFSLHSWGILVAIAFIVSLLLASRAAKRKNKVLVSHIWNIGLIIIVAAFIGARLLHVLYNLPFYLRNPLEIFALQQGGMVSHGGLLFALLFTSIYIKLKRLNFWKLANLLAPWVALGFAIARVGCFLAGHCFGTPTDLPWGIIYVNNPYLSPTLSGIPLHPTQLYHLAANFAIFFVLLKLSRTKERLNKNKQEKQDEQTRQTGQNRQIWMWLSKRPPFLLFLLFYGAQRLFIDFLRDYRLTSVKLVGLAPSQLIALGLIIFALAFIKKRRVSVL